MKILAVIGENGWVDLYDEEKNHAYIGGLEAL